jgi:biopolymer transport protein ExbD
MLDFVVNLLIFFIITAVFVKESGVSVGRPAGDSGRKDESQKIEIRFDGEILFDGRSIDRRAVRANLERVRATSPGLGIVIVADDGAPTGAVVDVADQARLAGVYGVTLVTFVTSGATADGPIAF